MPHSLGWQLSMRKAIDFRLMYIHKQIKNDNIYFYRDKNNYIFLANMCWLATIVQGK